MKKILPFLVFLVTWNEYKLIPHYDGIQYETVDQNGFTVGFHPEGHHIFDTVEMSTETETLQSQRDVDLFIGKGGPCGPGGNSWCESGGIQPPSAFNIQVKEIK